jgi:hypothetical protein
VGSGDHTQSNGEEQSLVEKTEKGHRHWDALSRKKEMAGIFPALTRKGAFMKGLTLIYVLTACTAAPMAHSAQWELEIETGRVSSGYNDVRIPGDTGTRFSLSEELSIAPSASFRARINLVLGKHTLSLLAAPLSLKAEGSFNRPVSFMGADFTAGTPTSGTYRFDSYRLTYRYALVRGPRFEAGLGFTAKIRDAAIRLASGSLSAEKTNVGFVPIINFHLCWKASSKVRFLFEGDALAAPQGRAEDVFAGVLFAVHKHIQLKAGYRLLEGGADNETVYNFALLHYGVVGFVWSL